MTFRNCDPLFHYFQSIITDALARKHRTFIGDKGLSRANNFILFQTPWSVRNKVGVSKELYCVPNTVVGAQHN